MFTDSFKTLALLAVCCLFSCTINAAERTDADIYHSLYEKLCSYPHRSPGSQEFDQCIIAIESICKQQGIQTTRQYYNTLFPKINTCSFTYNDKQIKDCTPLAPNSDIMLCSTDGRTLTGPCYYVGNGSISEISTFNLRNAIVCMELGSTHMYDVFSEGAQAVVFIDNQSATRWNTKHHFTTGRQNIPRLYISRETAQTYGLLQAQGEQASLHIESNWENRVTHNLLIHLPATQEKTFAYEEAEQLVFSATLDTFGLVPNRCKDNRKAANVALLVQTLVNAKDNPRHRDVLGVIWGSHRASQEAARHLYFIQQNANDQTEKTQIDALRQRYDNDFKTQQNIANFLQQPNFLERVDDPNFYISRKKIRELITARLNEINFQVGQLNLRLHEQEDARQRQILEDKTASRSRYKEFYGHMTELSAADIATIYNEYSKEFEQLTQELAQQVQGHLGQLKQYLYNLDSWKTSLDIFKNKKVILHLEFDYSNNSPFIVPNAFGTYYAYYTSPKDSIKPGSLTKSLERLNQSLKDYQASKHHLVTDMYIQGVNAAQLSGPIATPQNTEVAMANGTYAYHLQNLGDGRALDEMPSQRSVDISKLLPFNQHLIKQLSIDPNISIKFNLSTIKPHDKYLHQTHVRRLAKGSTEIEGIAVGAVCSVGSRSNQQCVVGYSSYAICQVDNDGTFFAPLMDKSAVGRVAAAIFDEHGSITHIGKIDGKFNLDLFFAYGGGFFTPYVTDNFDMVLSTYLYGGHSNNKFINFYDDHNKDERVYYTDKLSNFKTIDSSGLFILNETGDPKDKRYGNGLPLDPTSMRGINTIQQSAIDYQKINTRRLTALRENNIGVTALEDVHASAYFHIQDAEKARATSQTQLANKHEVFGLALSNRAYGPLKQVPKDLTSAIVILLLISIPFAFSMERLILGFATIYKQIFGFLMFFMLTFLILYLVHPAFSLSTTPSVIFLAFIIVILSGAVINIIMKKFQYELMALQGLMSKSHTQSKHSNVGLASVVIGISSMRNRPLKTALTATTVILLTFTVLVFGSFNAKEQVVQTFMGNSNGARCIQITRNALLHIPDRLRLAITDQYKPHYNVSERSGLFFDPTAYRDPYDTKTPCVAMKNGAFVQTKAVLGLQNTERQYDPFLAKALPFEIKQSNLYLSDEACKHLEIDIGDHISLSGQTYTLGGIFNSNAIRGLRQIDNKKAVPPDYLATISEMSGSRNSVTLINDQMNNLDAGSFRWTSADMLVIAHHQDVLAMDGCANIMMLYPKENAVTDINQTATEIAKIFPDPIFARTSEGDNQYFYTTAYSGSGFNDIWVPLLLGGLIIFSSLMGSIVDREREIYTFSALGLAPPNVAALFFAESSVYAVIGGMGGYLISQIVAAILTWLSSNGYYESPEMNFSSLSSIYTILMVMSIVLLSTIYPAIKAGKSANPGINRKWKMPDPIDGTLSFVFPFTISDHSLMGIVSFIAEHFHNHEDASLGMFAASQVDIQHLNTNDYQLTAHIALAPFDLGIAQEFALRSQDSDIDGIKEIHITLAHRGGSPDAWLRSNRRFLSDLRHQFLLWRSLPIETIEYYCNRTQENAHDI